MDVKISLKAARINCGLRQIDVAKHLDVSDRTICNWELGKPFPPSEMLFEMCELYHVPVNNIILR